MLSEIGSLQWKYWVPLGKSMVFFSNILQYRDDAFAMLVWVSNGC